MERGVPCCAADAARRVQKIWVGDHQVAVLELDRLMDEVRALGPGDEDEAQALLLKRAKVYNYIPPNAEERYAEGLLSEYIKRYPQGDE